MGYLIEQTVLTVIRNAKYLIFTNSLRFQRWGECNSPSENIEISRPTFAKYSLSGEVEYPGYQCTIF